MKRLFLFIVLNLAVLFVLTIAFNVFCALLGVDGHTWLTESGLDMQVLGLWALVFGMGGAFISLLISKPMAKWSTRATVIDGHEGTQEAWLIQTINDLAQRANIKMPEVAIYPGEANAFATGAFRNHALVAVSSDILQSMNKEELRAVLGHEISHVANGDMVTMALGQGVLNACVLFLSRAIAFAVDSAINNRDNNRRRGAGGVYIAVVYVLQFVLGILASIILCAYSRRREYAADAGSAKLLGSPTPMIAALRRLGGLETAGLPASLKAFGIAGGGVSLFSTHPSIEARIDALEKSRLVMH